MELFKHAKSLEEGGLYLKHDPKTDLTAIIAIYSNKLGPALGGCRFISYNSTEDAIIDSVRLARGMGYKCAAAGLPLGGGKSVIIRPQAIKDRKKFFESFGKFVEQLNGKYIAAIDSGTSQEDMNIIAKHTQYVACYSNGVRNHYDEFNGNPSPYTAIGVLKGMEACIKHKYQTDSFKDLHIVIQGLGNVGYFLAKLLHKKGAKLTVSDVSMERVNKCVTELGAQYVPLDKIYQTKSNIFAPCALGAILNKNNIAEINTDIIAGAANNQLAQDGDMNLLMQKNILYAPDFIINAGGVCFAYAQYSKCDQNGVSSQLDNIYTSLLNVFERAKAENLSTNLIAHKIAEERLQAEINNQQTSENAYKYEYEYVS